MTPCQLTTVGLWVPMLQLVPMAPTATHTCVSREARVLYGPRWVVVSVCVDCGNTRLRPATMSDSTLPVVGSEAPSEPAEKVAQAA